MRGSGQSGGERRRGSPGRAPLVADDAGDDVAEEGGIGVAVLLAVDLLAEAERLELGKHVRQRRAAEVHLVERLHGREAGGAALVGRPAACGRRLVAARLIASSPKRARSAIMASAASAAPPPLFCSATARPRPGLLVVLDRQDAVAEGERLVDGEVHDRPRRFVGDDVVMAGLAADHAAEDDEAVIADDPRSIASSAIGERRRDLEGAGHGDALVGRAGALERRERAVRAARRRGRRRSAPR